MAKKILVETSARHVHLSEEHLKVETQERSLIFGDVVVRVSPNYATVVHIDTDESNAANCKGEVYGEIVK